jgi:hypothetical protein
MALPKIDSPVYELELPLSKKVVSFRPFLVKEQKNLLMAMESDDVETVERNVRQVLTNCTVSQNININSLPVIDVEYFFINLRARSVGEIVENEYICNNVVDGKECGGKMKGTLNLLDVKVDMGKNSKDVIQLNDKISIKLKYPEFSLVDKIAKMSSDVDMVFEIVVDSIEYIFDGQQYYHANETTKEELLEFIESLNQEQFAKVEEFFNNLPTMNKTMEIKCPRCGFDHSIEMEGLESFFG